MCLDHRCIDVGNVPKNCYENCFNHGKCKDGHCVCYPDYQPPYCEKQKEGTKHFLPASKFLTTIKPRTSKPRTRTKRPPFTSLIFTKSIITRTRAYTATTIPTGIVARPTTIWTPTQRQTTTAINPPTRGIHDETDTSGIVLSLL